MPASPGAQQRHTGELYGPYWSSRTWKELPHWPPLASELAATAAAHSARVKHPGSFLGLASDPVIDHLVGLGVTAVELLPVHAFLNDRFLVQKGLVNYWGYQTLGFFAPEPRYLGQGGLWEFQYMVARLHAAGIEVILDVVYNHSCEGDGNGPTLSFRGLDNRAYYRLQDDKRHYVNDTGTGNTLDLEHPRRQWPWRRYAGDNARPTRVLTILKKRSRCPRQHPRENYVRYYSRLESTHE